MVECKKFEIPEAISMFRDLKVFSEDGFKDISNNLSEPPMICDSSIVLSQDEMAVLSKGPKFAVRQDISEENFKIELE